jgi:hypothetical protein
MRPNMSELCWINHFLLNVSFFKPFSVLLFCPRRGLIFSRYEALRNMAVALKAMGKVHYDWRFSIFLSAFRSDCCLFVCLFVCFVFELWGLRRLQKVLLCSTVSLRCILTIQSSLILLQFASEVQTNSSTDGWLKKVLSKWRLERKRLLVWILALSKKMKRSKFQSKFPWILFLFLLFYFCWFVMFRAPGMQRRSPRLCVQKRSRPKIFAWSSIKVCWRMRWYLPANHSSRNYPLSS